MAEPLNGDTIQFYQKLARDNKMWMSFGGIHEADLDEAGNKTNLVRNSHILINDTGNLVATYRKLHLFNVDTPEMKYRESKIVRAGDEIIPPIDTPAGKLGLQICYDIRFGEVSSILRKLGAEILTYPSAFSYSTGKAHWEILNRSRAIENQAFVISAAQIGDHNKKRKSWGHAMIVSPWGEILAECSNELECKVAELDLDEIQKVKNNMPCFEHRRDDVYRLEALKKTPVTNTCDYYLFENNKVFKETIFYETELCYAFTNIRCVVPGHVLVATKRVIPRLSDLSLEETKDFFVTICKVQKVVESYHGAKSATVTVQDGPEAGQTVKHLHCHVMPRKPGDFEDNDEIYVQLQNHDAPNVQTRFVLFFENFLWFEVM
jgi:predicted amidohydrolase/diadenosine tetraphosphate (Ap4A) HIT family hydrolase